LFWGTQAAGTTATAGQNWIGLYDSAGNRLANVGIDARITATPDLFTETISVALTPGWYWVAWVMNAATTPNTYKTNVNNIAANILNFNLTASAYRAAINGTSQTTLTSTLTPSSNTAATWEFWAAIA
jgi:hypothetical protein